MTLADAPRARLVEPGSFEPEQHVYPRALNAQPHPLVRAFLRMDNRRIAQRYAHLHPEVRPEAIDELLASTPRHFRWAGADLFHAATAEGVRRVVVVETNSSPSGQKSMPLLDESEPLGGYGRLLSRALLPLLKSRRGLPHGVDAVLYDKNEMEASGYAAALAELTGRPCWLAPFPTGAADPPVRVRDGLLELRDEAGAWHPIRAALRYVTQRPWDRIPPLTRTALLNPVLCCLAGGRNKALAAKAYDFYNAEIAETGLRIQVPDTIWDVSREEVPLWVRRMDGFAVVKNPYSNAGQGVWTITSEAELRAFMDLEQRYDRFIVQALVGNSGWSSRGEQGRFFHIGTVPDRKGRIYAADLRFMVGAGPEGFFPVALYARRARRPLSATLADGGSSWDMLGTNLSVPLPDGGWTTETQRLLLADERDFNRLGMGLDVLIEAYLQTVLAVTAIDRMAGRLVTTKGTFRRRLFASLNPDERLAAEILR